MRAGWYITMDGEPQKLFYERNRGFVRSRLKFCGIFQVPPAEEREKMTAPSPCYSRYEQFCPPQGCKYYLTWNK